MKRRGWRITIGAAALVAVLVGVLTVACWGTVRDHVEAWRFQLTRKTKTIELVAGSAGFTTYAEHVLHAAANELRSPVIFDPQEGDAFFRALFMKDVLGRLETSDRLEGMALLETSDRLEGMALLEKNGWRVLEQRFPRRAYVVIRDAETIPDRPIPESYAGEPR